MRNIGLDIGDRRIGVAISDAEQILASPLTTLVIDDEGENKVFQSISSLVAKYQVHRIVIGLPFSMNGSVGIQATKVKSFTEKLAEYVKVQIEYYDERLSTVAVDRLMKAADSKKRKHREHRDAAAAAYILQGYLDSLKKES